MKLTITKPDGTRIDVEGTAEECAALISDTRSVITAPTYTPLLPAAVVNPSSWVPVRYRQQSELVESVDIKLTHNTRQ